MAPVSDPHWDYSYGQAAINWAREVLDIELLPWQQFLLLEGCARRNNRFKYRTLLSIVARQNGKTMLATVRILAGICLFGEQFAVGAAQTRNVAMESWLMALDLAQAAGLPVGKVRFQTGAEQFWIGNGRYRIVAANQGGARGLSGVDLVVLDEVRQQKNWEAYGAIDKTRRARPDSQLWAITTEGDLSSAVLNKLQDSAKENILAGQESPLGYWEWSAAPTDHPGKVTTWAQANPSLGWTLDEEVVQAEYQTDPSEIFEVEVLCRKVSSIKAWVKPADFDNCSSDQPFPVDKPFVIALDAGPELRHVSIVAGALDEDLHLIELVAQYAGPQALTAAEKRLGQLLERWKPYALVTLHRSPGEASVGRVAEAHGVDHVTVRPADWARACRAFYGAVNQRTLRHPGGQGITNALAATKRAADGLVSSVHRVNAEADIDAAIAAVLAMWLPTQQPAPDPVPNWTVF
jgi:hypothetical protein